MDKMEQKHELFFNGCVNRDHFTGVEIINLQFHWKLLNNCFHVGFLGRTTHNTSL
jgi:hypothetical protein